jgi:hypothetical protein
MTLRDRLRRWWSPARWEDDHPAERKHREQPNRKALGRWFSKGYGLGGGNDAGDLHGSDFEGDFKKPR